MELNSKVPPGPTAEKWTNYRSKVPLVAPQNKRKLDVIVVGSGLAGASAAASLGELGYNVQCFTFHDSPRRAHSIAAQGGINAAKNYANDGDSVFRLFYDTVKGGDYRAREANVYRLAEESILSISVSHRVFLLLVSMVVCWKTGHLVVYRYQGLFTLGVKPGNSY